MIVYTNMNKNIEKLILFLILALLIISSCRPDENFVEGSVEIRVSEDTIRFDTVFTEIGTTTKLFKLYNDNQNTLLVDRIELNNQTNFFRLNIDGIPGGVQENIEIAAFDSLYVFVEATIDPNLPLSISPYIIEDQVQVTINDQNKTVYLEAWGQNANYLPNKEASSDLNFYTCNMQEWVWDDPKPYVIYGSIIIDSCQVVWPKGTEIYVHGGIAINDLGIYNDGLIFFLQNSSLNSQGTAEEPVTVKTDRLEPFYSDQGGQWSGIILGPNSRTHRLRYTTIQNSIVGIRVDSNAIANFQNCQFLYTSGSGLIGRHASIDATNCLFHNNLLNGVQMVFGGNYNFTHCTIASYDGQESGITMNNFQCLDQFCENHPLLNNLRANFTNCIISGNDTDEISFGDWTPDVESDFNYSFRNCYVQVDELLEPEAYPNFFDQCGDCINGTNFDSIYIDQRMDDFHLDTMSLVIDKGLFIEEITIDLEGNPREPGLFDIGCYEFQK